MATTRHAASVTRALNASRLYPMPAGSEREGWLTVGPDVLGNGAIITVRKPDDLSLDQAARVVADALHRAGFLYCRNEARTQADGVVTFECVHKKTKSEIAMDLAAYCLASVRDAHERGCTGTRITELFMLGVAQSHGMNDVDGWIIRKAARIIADRCQAEGTLELVDFSDAPFAIRPRR